jgi:hypothetical protein
MFPPNRKDLRIDSDTQGHDFWWRGRTASPKIMTITTNLGLPEN